MPDYKEMYFKMVRAAEKAIRILTEAQQECEELYLQDGDEEDALVERLKEVLRENGEN